MMVSLVTRTFRTSRKRTSERVRGFQKRTSERVGVF